MQDSARQTTQDYLFFMHSRYSASRNEAEADLAWRLARLAPGATVLDLACGWGRLSHLFAERGAVSHGIDLDPVMIEAARSGQQSGATFEVRDMRDLDGLPRYDAIVCWWSSFGIFDDETDLAILRDLRAHLRPGGQLVIETFNGSHFLGEAHTTPYGRTLVSRDGQDLLVDSRTFSDDGERLRGTRVVVREGRVGEMKYDLRVFTGSELRTWMHAAGFTSVGLYDRDGSPLRRDSYSVVVAGTACPDSPA